MKKLRKRLYKIIIAFLILLIAVFLPLEDITDLGSDTVDTVRLCIFLLSYLIAGGDVVKEAAENILHGQIFDENFLMTVATVGAFLVSDYPEAVAVMLFYQVGELFQSYAVNKSRKSIAELMDIRPDYANIKNPDGSLTKVSPEEISVGQIIVVKPGEKIALDGVVTSGSSSLDVSALTGESLLRDITVEDAVISGSVNREGVIEVKVNKEFGESTVSKILDLVENASDKKAETENFVTRFAKYYTPIVCLLALLTAVLPPLVTGGGSDDWSEWIYRALSFLVISCPCALVISVPLSFFGGLGGASAHGVLIKGSNYLEALGRCDTIVFDKTGTLTKGVFRVQEIITADGSEEDLIKYAAIGEGYSGHPIAHSIKEYYFQRFHTDNRQLQSEMAEDEITETAGFGTIVNHEGKKIVVGNARLMEQEGISCPTVNKNGTLVYVAINNHFSGCIVIADELKQDTTAAVAEMKRLGIRKTVMLTGDRADIAADIGKTAGIDEIHAELLPEDKVNELEKILTNQSSGSRTAYVGDGINDAPVLARADIGIAMGALGSDAAIEAADIVLMDDNPMGIGKAIRIARKTIKIVKQNITFAIGVKILVLFLAVFGIANMWAAVFADVGVAVIAILNALRALRISES